MYPAPFSPVNTSKTVPWAHWQPHHYLTEIINAAFRKGQVS